MEYFIVIQMNTIKQRKSYLEEATDVMLSNGSHTQEYTMYNSIYIKFKNRIVLTFGKEIIEGMKRGF